MMRVKYYFLILLFIAPLLVSFHSNAVFIAGGDLMSPSYPASGIEFGPADSIPLGDAVFVYMVPHMRLCFGGDGIFGQNGISANGLKYDLGRITIQMPLVYAGSQMSINGKMDMFKSTVDEYAFSFWYTQYRGFGNGAYPYEFNGVIPTSAYGKGFKDFPYIGNSEQDVFTGNIPNAKRAGTPDLMSGGLVLDVGGGVYKMKRPKPGPVTIDPYSIGEPNTFATFRCYDTANQLQEIYQLRLNGLTTSVGARTCEPNESATVVNMNPISVEALNNASSTALLGTKTVTFSLMCQNDIAVNFSVVDLVDTTNTTDISKLTKDSTAKGVGYSVSYNAPLLRPMFFGPDISSTLGKNSGIYVDRRLVGNSGGPTTGGETGLDYPVSFPIQFSYRKTGETVVQGTATSMIGITYSYQ